MPKIETLNQSSRMNVGSPTSIRSSEGARMTGENIAQFGADIGRAAMTMGQVYRQAQADEDKLDLATINEESEALSHAAEAQAIQNYNPEADKEGTGLFKSYQESYQKEASKLIENISDPALRRQAAVLIRSRENSKAQRLYETNAKFKAQHLENKSLQAYNTMGSNVYQNPETVLTKIADSDNLIASSEFTYSPVIKEQLMIERRKGLAMSAISGHIRNGHFDKAQAALTGELAPFLGGDVEKLGAGIQEAKMRNRAQRQQDTYQAAQNFEKAQKEQEDSLVGELGVRLATATNFAAKDEIRAEILTKRARNEISATTADRLLNTKPAIFVSGTVPQVVAKKYFKQLSAETLDPKFNENVIRDTRAGLLDEDYATKLLTSAASKRQLEKIAKDPSAKAELRQASTMVAALTQPTDPKFIGQQLAMQTEIDAMVSQGQRPTVAAEKVIMKHHKNIVNDIYVPGIPRGVQGNYKTLKNSEVMIRKQYEKLKSQGLIDDANALRRNYKVRLESLQATEGYNERTR